MKGIESLVFSLAAVSFKRPREVLAWYTDSIRASHTAASRVQGISIEILMHLRDHAFYDIRFEEWKAFGTVLEGLDRLVELRLILSPPLDVSKDSPNRADLINFFHAHLSTIANGRVKLSIVDQTRL